jgi:DNA polymerase
VYVADPREYRKAATTRVTTGEVVDINWTRIYGGKATENLIQALARIVVAEQMAEAGQHYHVAFQVHDEVIIVAPDAEATHAQQHLEQIMSTAPVWAAGLPVACESGMADNYGET